MNLESKLFGLGGFTRAGDAPLAGAVDRECCWSSCSDGQTRCRVL